MPRPLSRLRSALARARADQSGVAAVEFGLVAPLLFFSLLAVTDLGFAIRERIWIGHVLRAGGQPAMRDDGEALVLATLAAAVDGRFAIGATAGPDTIALDVERVCYCPTTGVEDPTCTATCAVKPESFYTLSAQKVHEGIFLPDMTFAPEVVVEVQ